MKIFVTGGAGFMGSALVNFLLKKGYKVTIFDNFSNSSKEKVTSLTKEASLIKGDITNYHSLVKALKDFDIVIHLAAQIDVEQSIKKPEFTHKVNVEGTVNLLRACVENKIKNVIAASSAAVYGNPETLPLSESSMTVPLSPYGASKLSMEYYLKAFSYSYDMNCISLRIFNAYGPYQSNAYAGVITKFMNYISKNKSLVIFGDGANTRDFVSINDVIESFHKSIKKIKNKKGNVYNIGSGKYITIKKLAQLMISLSGKKLKIKYTFPKKGDIKHSQTSIKLANQELQYFSQVKLKDGLKKLLEP